jgi:hypothetical protein
MVDLAAHQVTHSHGSAWSRWLLLMLAVVLLGGWLWWQAPRPMRVVGTYPAAEDTLQPCTTGFLYQTHSNELALREWDGTARWSQTLPPTLRMRFRSNKYNVYVSHNGRCYTELDKTKPRQITVTIWVDGRRIGARTYKLPSPSMPINSAIFLHPLNNGQVLVFIYKISRHTSKTAMTDIFLQDGNHIIAQGSLPGLLDYSAPDARILLDIYNWRLTRISIVGNHFVVSSFQKVTPNLELHNYGTDFFPLFPSLCNDSVAINDQGEVFHPNGSAIYMPGDWRLLNTISPNGRWVMLRQGDMLKAFCPATGDGWTFRSANGSEGDVTDDGRFVMITRQVLLPGALREIVGLIGFGTMEYKTAVIIERPGRVRAVLRIPDDVSSWWISPDGHRVAMMRNASKVVLYRW